MHWQFRNVTDAIYIIREKEAKKAMIKHFISFYLCECVFVRVRITGSYLYFFCCKNNKGLGNDSVTISTV